ncbi:MAG TPA: lactate racemase domain-containing protein [Gemmata sp.]|jgi:nickel-dependent lactate racemase|nr:lactate racemase domain-containing protein [Gemmata sp.]
MANSFELMIGLEPWHLTVPSEQLVPLSRAAVVPPIHSAAELTRTALEHPFGFEALRRAVTPDDRVTIVIDPTLPDVAAMLGEVINHLGSAAIHPESVTILTPPSSQQGWVDDLADEYAEVKTEVHDPSDQQKLAYLATTQSGRRLYMNRTLVDADFVIVLSGRRYDPLTGYAGAAAAVYPALADEEIRTALAGEFSTDAPGKEPWPVRAEAEDILWLLGMPFLVQAIEGEGDTIQSVVTGLPNSSEEGIRRQDSRWSATVSEQADAAIAAISGSTGRVTFLDLAKAAASSARVVRKGGRIAVLSAAAPVLGDGARLLRSMDGPTGARKLLAKEKPDDWAACALWAFAARNHSLFLASGYPDEVAEELFTTPIRTASEVQRLIDSGGRVVVIPDAHKMMVGVRES